MKNNNIRNKILNHPAVEDGGFIYEERWSRGLDGYTSYEVIIINLKEHYSIPDSYWSNKFHHTLSDTSYTGLYKQLKNVKTCDCFFCKNKEMVKKNYPGMNIAGDHIRDFEGNKIVLGYNGCAILPSDKEDYNYMMTVGKLGSSVVYWNQDNDFVLWINKHEDLMRMSLSLCRNPYNAELLAHCIRDGHRLPTSGNYTGLDLNDMFLAKLSFTNRNKNVGDWLNYIGLFISTIQGSKKEFGKEVPSNYTKEFLREALNELISLEIAAVKGNDITGKNITVCPKCGKECLVRNYKPFCKMCDHSIWENGFDDTL